MPEQAYPLSWMARGVVTGVADEAPGVKTYTVALRGYPDPKPGQFNMVYAYGLGDVPISIAGARRGGEVVYVEHTVRVVGAVTRGIFMQLGAGSPVGIRGPFGTQWPLREAEGRDLVFVAGGLGLAPLRMAIKSALERAEAYGSIYVLYGARSPEAMLYKRELPSYDRPPKARLLLSVDAPAPGWPHHVGLVTDLLKKVEVSPAGAYALVCGPEQMMRAAVGKLLAMGFKSDRVFVSLERRMRCGVGICGTCQFGHLFICKSGPVLRLSDIEDYWRVEGI